MFIQILAKMLCGTDVITHEWRKIILFAKHFGDFVNVYALVTKVIMDYIFKPLANF